MITPHSSVFGFGLLPSFVDPSTSCSVYFRGSELLNSVGDLSIMTDHAGIELRVRKIQSSSEMAINWRAHSVPFVGTS